MKHWLIRIDWSQKNSTRVVIKAESSIKAMKKARKKFDDYIFISPEGEVEVL